MRKTIVVALASGVLTLGLGGYAVAQEEKPSERPARTERARPERPGKGRAVNCDGIDSRLSAVEERITARSAKVKERAATASAEGKTEVAERLEARVARIAERLAKLPERAAKVREHCAGG